MYIIKYLCVYANVGVFFNIISFSISCIYVYKYILYIFRIIFSYWLLFYLFYSCCCFLSMCLCNILQPMASTCHLDKHRAFYIYIICGPIVNWNNFIFVINLWFWNLLRTAISGFDSWIGYRTFLYLLFTVAAHKSHSSAGTNPRQRVKKLILNFYGYRFDVHLPLIDISLDELSRQFWKATGNVLSFNHCIELKENGLNSIA